MTSLPDLIRVEASHTAAASSLRDIVFGVNDGLVSITGLVVGVTASHMATHAILLVGLAALSAATVAMAMGAYLSTAAHNEYCRAEWSRELKELREEPEEERRESEDILRKKGFNAAEAASYTRHLMRHEALWADFMMKEELGLTTTSLDSPWASAWVMALAVIGGSLPPLLPYVFIPNPALALHWAIGLAVVSAFGLGVVKGTVARGSWWKSGMQFVVVALLAVAGGLLAGKALGMLAGR